MDTYALANFEKALKKLDDDQLLEAFHTLSNQVGKVPDSEKDLTLQKHYRAELEMISRFGLGRHMDRYRTKYPGAE